MTPSCENCTATSQQLHRCLRVLQAARDWYERRSAQTMAALLDAIRDGLERADSRPLDVQRREAEEMAARWRARADALRGEP